MAQFTFFKFTELISHVLFYLFGVNCAFLIYRYYAFAAKPFDVSSECFALLLKVKLTCDNGTLSP